LLFGSHCDVFRKCYSIQFELLPVQSKLDDLLVHSSFYNGVYTSSIAVHISSNSGSIDGIFGTGYTGLGISPSAYLAYYDIFANWNSSANFASADVSGAGGFIGNAILSLDEIDSGSNVVQTIYLKDLPWTTTDTSYGTGGLLFATFQGKQVLNPNFEVDITFILSDVVGVLNLAGKPVITPRVLESVIEIINFPYKSTSNRVRLNIGVGSAAGDIQASGTGTGTTLVSGSGDGTVYITLNGQAQINGDTQDITISGFVDATGIEALNNTNLVEQVNVKYGASASFKINSVIFPAGATHIQYDPSMGTGTPPQSSGMSFHPSILLMVVALFFFKTFV